MGFYPKTIGRSTITSKILQTLPRRHIPATVTLGLEIVASDKERTVLSVPRAPNRNHKNIVLGGSTALAVATCGWAAIYMHFPETSDNTVIQQGGTRYPYPVRNSLSVVTRSDSVEGWQEMCNIPARRGKGKIVSKTEVFSEGELTAVFTGAFVALKN